MVSDFIDAVDGYLKFEDKEARLYLESTRQKDILPMICLWIRSAKQLTSRGLRRTVKNTKITLTVLHHVRTDGRPMGSPDTMGPWEGMERSGGD